MTVLNCRNETQHRVIAATDAAQAHSSSSWRSSLCAESILSPGNSGAPRACMAYRLLYKRIRETRSPPDLACLQEESSSEEDSDEDDSEVTCHD